jgi:hypothetical protein
MLIREDVRPTVAPVGADYDLLRFVLSQRDLDYFSYSQGLTIYYGPVHALKGTAPAARLVRELPVKMVGSLLSRHCGDSYPHLWRLSSAVVVCHDQ